MWNINGKIDNQITKTNCSNTTVNGLNFSNINETEKYSNTSCCKKNIKKILITLGIILGIGVTVFLILLFTVILKKHDDQNTNVNLEETDKLEETNKIEMTDKIIDTDKIEETDKIELTDKIEVTDKILDTDKIEETDKIEATDTIEVTDKIEETDRITDTDKIEEEEETLEETEIIKKNKCNERCLLCKNSNSIEECANCIKGFDLYQGECIIYAFKLTYFVDYYYEKIKLFNPKKIKNIYVLKIEDKVINLFQNIILIIF